MLYKELQACLSELAAASSDREIDIIKSKYTGKKSFLHSKFVALKDLNEEEKKQQGLVLNKLRDEYAAAFLQAYKKVSEELVNKLLYESKVDPTMISRPCLVGSRHPVTLAKSRLVNILKSLGFSLVSGPEIEDEEHNFSLLNVAENHPARAEQDTFYLQNMPFLLRTHTSPVQVRMLKKNSPPVKIIAPGRVYRSDMDATHTPMFHQLEGLVIDEDVNMGHLKAIISFLLKEFFNQNDLKLRFRPAYFPFTEPSAEVDIWWNGRWLEVLGAGMVHPNVLQGVNIDSRKYRGYAFGLGIDRLAMLRYSINDLRSMFLNDHRFSKSFKGFDR